MQAFFFRVSVHFRVPGVLAETVETGDKNRDDFHCVQMSLVMGMRFIFDDD